MHASVSFQQKSKTANHKSTTDAYHFLEVHKSVEVGFIAFVSKRHVCSIKHKSAV